MGQVMRLLRHRRSYSPILPEEILFEIISRLSVKHVMRLRCVNKFFNTLIFDPHFIQMHLNKSSRNSQLALTHSEDNWNSSSIAAVSIPDLLQNRFNIIHNDPYYQFSKSSRIQQRIVGSCNGLLCLIGSCTPLNYKNYWICFWNPAMRIESKKFQTFFDFYPDRHFKFNFSFGYDNLSQTYKVVAFFVEVKHGSKPKSVVKVFGLRDNFWRYIQCLPVLPLCCLLDDINNNNRNHGVHLNGTINWLALHNGINININIKSIVSVDQCVILSLDLSTETYTKLLLPRRLDKVSRYLPKLVVLMDCLCFCYDFEKTHFVIWQMKDFGVQDSWIQLFKFSYRHFYSWLYPLDLDLLPLYLFENSDTLILTNVKLEETFIYNCRDNKIKTIGNANHIKWSQTKSYVESLVSTR